MMSAPDTTRYEIVRGKLSKLIEQCGTLSIEDFPYPDSKAALFALKAQAEKLKSQSDIFPTASKAIQQQFLLQVNYKLESISQILGIIARSNAMRNNFEIYNAFRSLCTNFFESEIHFILSSEWNYTPFTYPMNLQELPDFIIIGLPAAESNNVLIFPAAGHELGHSIWLNQSLAENYSGQVYSEIGQYAKSSNILSSLIPKPENEEQADLFAKQIEEQFIAEATSSCLRQIEELFCDFVGLHLFGEGYLQAFRYLVAPGGGRRSLKYPQTKERARLLEQFGAALGIQISGYSDDFMDGHESQGHPYEILVLRAADSVRDLYVNEMFSAAEKRVAEAGVPIPTQDEIGQSLVYFEHGMPTDKIGSIGSLITAAWRLYLDLSRRKSSKGSHSPIGYVSDLVLKSVEAFDFREEMKRAQR